MSSGAAAAAAAEAERRRQEANVQSIWGKGGRLCRGRRPIQSHLEAVPISLLPSHTRRPHQ
jgi:hypothetical protein